VWKVPVAGGEETKVLGLAGGFQFAVVADGIYFIEPGSSGSAGWIKGKLKFFSFAKGAAGEGIRRRYFGHGPQRFTRRPVRSVLAGGSFRLRPDACGKLPLKGTS
jgi:hypothetical protein